MEGLFTVEDDLDFLAESSLFLSSLPSCPNNLHLGTDEASRKCKLRKPRTLCIHFFALGYTYKVMLEILHCIMQACRKSFPVSKRSIYLKLGQKSTFYPKIHTLKITIFHKIHISEISFFTKFT